MDTMRNRQHVPGEIRRPQSRLSRFFIHFLMPAAALVIGGAITAYLLNTGPQARPVKRLPNAVLVEVEKLTAGPQKTLISAMGEIIPAREIDIKPQVRGEIITVSEEFQPGGYFLEGDEMIVIDKTDYRLQVQQLESDVAKAESDLALEMGNQRIAEREYALLGEEVSKEEKNLILRKPQLEKLQAVLDDAKARLGQARINLERTRITAPFNGVVLEKMIDTGAKVGESTILAKYVGTDFFWLRLTLPLEKLQWLSIPDSNEATGASVTIFSQGGSSPAAARRGKVIRLIASLEEQGRMAQLLVKVDDPLCQKTENHGKQKLLLGSYVQAEVEGKSVESGFSINRSNIHEGSSVWLMDEEGRLDIRPVEIAYRGRHKVIVAGGISDGENLIVSSLSSPVSGTPLRLRGDEQEGDQKLQKKNSAREEDTRRMNRAD